MPASAYDLLSSYREKVSRALASVDADALERAADRIADLAERGATLFVCGNGGSAAISNHLLCDVVKGVRTDTALKPKVVSLSANVEILTAIANDIAYEEVFAYQLQSLARPGDGILTISSSGDSENVVRALAWGRDNGLATLAMSGFDGGRTRAIAEIALHVEGDN
jgi:phosphoheptose isomerase